LRTPPFKEGGYRATNAAVTDVEARSILKVRKQTAIWGALPVVCCVVVCAAVCGGTTASANLWAARSQTAPRTGTLTGAGNGRVSGLVLDVPYVHQEKDGCGSASLAMVLQYWKGKGATVEAARMDAAQIQRELYAVKAHGIYASEMERYLRDAGMQVWALRGEWSDFRAQLSKGRPLIAGLKPRGAAAHYVVVVGVDAQDAGVLVNDPERGKLVRMEREEFEKGWQGTEKWTLLAVPKQSE